MTNSVKRFATWKWARRAGVLGAVGAFLYPAKDAETVSENNWRLQTLRMMPLRAMSRTWGAIHQVDLPLWMREPVYALWAYVFNCSLHECAKPLREYPHLSAFFTRELIDSARPIDADHILVSPVDGLVMECGKLDHERGTMTQIKGVEYETTRFLGTERIPKQHDDCDLYYANIYLAPGDYHRIHGSTLWQMDCVRHFPGELFPVNAFALRIVPQLYTLNERVVFEGAWKHGYFSMTAVGATNVGSVVPLGNVAKHTNLRTNVREQDHADPHRSFEYRFPVSCAIDAASQVAMFTLGSTVVLVFEGPRDFRFVVQPGQTVRMGEGIGRSR